GNGGTIFVSVDGQLSINGSNAAGFTGIRTRGSRTANAGNVSVSVAGLLSINGTSSSTLAGIAADSEEGSTGGAGSVTVIAGSLSIVNTGQISSNTFGTGSGGSVTVTVVGQLSINGAVGPTGIVAASKNSGDAGSVTVSARDLVIVGSG